VRQRTRRALYRENRRVSLVDVTDIEETDAAVCAVCVLIPTPGLDNRRRAQWPIHLGREISRFQPASWGSGYLSLYIDFARELIDGTVAFAQELERREPGRDHNEAVIRFMGDHR
jgi:hypothetical protein